MTKSLGDESGGYSSPCSTDDECQHITKQLVCFNETCLCLEGYVPLGRHLCYDTRGSGNRSTESESDLDGDRLFFVSQVLQWPDVRLRPVPKRRRNPSTTWWSNHWERSAIHVPMITFVDVPFLSLIVTMVNVHVSKVWSLLINIRVSKVSVSRGFSTALKTRRIRIDANEPTSTISTLPPVDYKSLLGGQCLTHRNCHTSTAVCLESICACPKGHFPVDDWSCLPETGTGERERHRCRISLSPTYSRVIRRRLRRSNFDGPSIKKNHNSPEHHGAPIHNDNCLSLVAMVALVGYETNKSQFSKYIPCSMSAQPSVCQYG